MFGDIIGFEGSCGEASCYPENAKEILYEGACRGFNMTSHVKGTTLNILPFVGPQTSHASNFSWTCTEIEHETYVEIDLIGKVMGYEGSFNCSGLPAFYFGTNVSVDAGDVVPMFFSQNFFNETRLLELHQPMGGEVETFMLDGSRGPSRVWPEPRLIEFFCPAVGEDLKRIVARGKFSKINIQESIICNDDTPPAGCSI